VARHIGGHRDGSLVAQAAERLTSFLMPLDGFEDILTLDADAVPKSGTGVVLCLEPCCLRGACRLGILSERLEGEDSIVCEIECPNDQRETADLAHGTWTAAVMSELCGHLPVQLGLIAFMGTLTVRFQAAVPLRERLIGRATLTGRERRKLFVSATLTSAVAGTELASGSMVMIAAQQANIEDRFGTASDQGR
jgi:acyl-coenzyme A thioesterase PaaI-like protein